MLDGEEPPVWAVCERIEPSHWDRPGSRWNLIVFFFFFFLSPLLFVFSVFFSRPFCVHTIVDSCGTLARHTTGRHLIIYKPRHHLYPRAKNKEKWSKRRISLSPACWERLIYTHAITVKQAQRTIEQQPRKHPPYLFMLTVCDFRFPVEIFLSIRKPQLSIISVPKRKRKKRGFLSSNVWAAMLVCYYYDGNMEMCRKKGITWLWCGFRFDFFAGRRFLPLNALLLEYPYTHTHTPPRDTYIKSMM